MDLPTLTARIEELNEHTRMGETGLIADKQERLNHELEPFGLVVLLVSSPYSEAYPVVYAALSLKAESN